MYFLKCHLKITKVKNISFKLVKTRTKRYFYSWYHESTFGFDFVFFFFFMSRLAIRSSDCHIWDLSPVPRECNLTSVSTRTTSKGFMSLLFLLVFIRLSILVVKPTDCENALSEVKQEACKAFTRGTSGD